ncbi:unnamed protein product [Scytosiphon promiscuus]
MLRNAGLSRQGRRLAGRVHGNGALATAAVDVATRHTGNNGACNSGGNRNGSSVLRPAAPQLLLSHSLRVRALHRGSALRGTSGLGGSASTAMCALGGRPDQSLWTAWSGAAAAAAGGSLGARRSIWGRSNDANGGTKGSGDVGGEGSNGFPDTGGAADGDRWEPPPDAWTPDGAPPAIPEDVPPVPDFDARGGFSDATASAVDAAAAVPDSVTAVTATGLSAADLTMYPHHICMQIIDFVQATAGVPYWQAIIMVSVAAKIAVLPAVTTFVGMTKRLNMVKPEMAVHQDKMQDIKMRMEANPEIKEAAMQEMTLISQEMGALLKQHRIHIPKMFLSMFAQFPIFISIFVATRDMGTYFPGYLTGGFDWMPNLSAPDPTWTLPILTSASLMLLIELGSEMPVAQGAEKPKVNPKVMFRVMSVISIPIAFTLPSGVLLYWTTSNIFGMVQRGMLELRPVQKALGWPMPEDMPQPVVKEEPQEPKDADSVSDEDLERWGGGGKGASGEVSRGAAEAAERAREAVAKASKVRHEELKREHEERSGGDRRV